MRGGSNEWVHNFDAVDLTPMLKIFAEEFFAATLDCGTHNKAIPPGEGMLSVKIERGVEKVTAGSFAEHHVKPLLNDLAA
jgi:hypothetical protein